MNQKWLHKRIIHFLNFKSLKMLNNFVFLKACRCNSLGSIPNKRKNLYTIKDSNLSRSICNQGDCDCKTGYVGKDCNSCQYGYFLSNVSNGEITCDGKYRISIYFTQRLNSCVLSSSLTGFSTRFSTE